MTYRHGQLGREPVVLRGDWFGPLAWSVAASLWGLYARVQLESWDGALRLSAQVGLFGGGK